MSRDRDIDLLQFEKVDMILRPHLLSFLKYDLLAVYLIGVMAFLRWFYFFLKNHQGILNLLNKLLGFIPGLRAEDAVLMVLFWAILLLSGQIVGILWVSKMPLLCMVLIGITGTTLELYYPNTGLDLPGWIEPPMTKLWLMAVAAVIGLALTEFYRRGHRYYITNYRVIMKKGFISKEEREVVYDKITDLYIHQGLLGRIFNYGTVIPISASGFGMGQDSATASTFVATSVKKGMLGIGFGGERGVQRPRASTYFSLYGVPNPSRLRIVIVNHQLEVQEAPILKRIERILKEKPEEEERKGVASDTK